MADKAMRSTHFHQKKKKNYSKRTKGDKMTNMRVLIPCSGTKPFLYMQWRVREKRRRNIRRGIFAPFSIYDGVESPQHIRNDDKYSSRPQAL